MILPMLIQLLCCFFNVISKKNQLPALLARATFLFIERKFTTQFSPLFQDLVLFSLPYYDVALFLCRMVIDISETTNVSFGMNAHSDLSFHFISDEFCSCGVNLFSGQLTTTELMQIRMQLIQEISNHKPKARQTCQLKVLCQLSAYMMIQWEPTKYNMHNHKIH